MSARLPATAPGFVRRIGMVVLTLVLGACAIAHPPERVESKVDDDVTQGVLSSSATPLWWQALNDAQLDRLVRTALMNNADIEAASARLRQAQAMRDSEAAQKRPELSLATQATRQRVAESRSPAEEGGTTRTPAHVRNFFDMGARLQWELDIAGRLGLSIQASEAALTATRMDQASVARQLVHETIQAWSEVQLTQAQLGVAQGLRQQAQRLLAAQQRRLEAGLIDRGTVRLAREELTRAEVAAADLTQRQAAALARLATLTDHLPADFRWDAAPLAEPHPVAALQTPPILDTHVIDQRPDVRAAWQRLLAATHRAEQARLERHPRLSLNSGVGLASETLRRWLRGEALVWVLGAALQAPLLDGGRVQARIDQAHAERDEQQALYRLTVLRAWHAVSDAQSASEAARTRWTLAKAQAADHAADAQDALRRQRQGRETLASTIAADIASLHAQQTLLQRQHELLLAWADSHRVLGW